MRDACVCLGIIMSMLECSQARRCLLHHVAIDLSFNFCLRVFNFSRAHSHTLARAVKLSDIILSRVARIFIYDGSDLRISGTGTGEALSTPPVRLRYGSITLIGDEQSEIPDSHLGCNLQPCGGIRVTRSLRRLAACRFTWLRGKRGENEGTRATVFAYREKKVIMKQS